MMHPWNKLTKAQLRVALRIAVGDSCAEIADEMCLSKKTIDDHRREAMMRLGLRGNVNLARAAIRDGMVTLDEHLERARQAHIRAQAEQE